MNRTNFYRKKQARKCWRCRFFIPGKYFSCGYQLCDNCVVNRMLEQPFPINPEVSDLLHMAISRIFESHELVIRSFEKRVKSEK
jgi:hypothetical protein